MAYRPGGEAVYGRLNTDRPSQFKLNGVYVLPSKTTVAGVFRAASGIPISRQVNMITTTPVFYEGRLSDGRTPWLTLTDLSVQQDIPMPGGRVRGQLSLNVLNLFDQKGVTDVFRTQTREVLPTPLETFFAGFDIQTAHREHCRDPHRSAVPPEQCMAGGA